MFIFFSWIFPRTWRKLGRSSIYNGVNLRTFFGGVGQFFDGRKHRAEMECWKKYFFNYYSDLQKSVAPNSLRFLSTISTKKIRLQKSENCFFSWVSEYCAAFWNKNPIWQLLRERGLHIVNQDMARYRSAVMSEGFQGDANPSWQLFAYQGMHDTTDTHAPDLMKTERKLRCHTLPCL